MSKVSQDLDTNTSEFEITMKLKLKKSDPMPSVTIKTSDDVEIFLAEIISGMEFRNPLCITFERKSNLAIPMDRHPSHHHLGKRVMLTQAKCLHHLQMPNCLSICVCYNLSVFTS